MVLVKKSSGAWRLCVDFTDLNKACPKDNHPLPKIDRLVDSTAGHALLSFMDANAGYHQIPMAEKDRPHTAYITSQGVYCYKMMRFRLKNAGATYQRIVNKIFLVDERGIKANPDKGQAVLDMRSPKNVREVQRLTGCLAALGRFLSRSTDKSLTFFRALKRKELDWDEEVEKAFQQLKQHLSTLPKLISPLLGKHYMSI